MADAPVEALLARADELAGRWASALVAARPLAEMAEAPLESLAREAPALCGQLARALSCDVELERLLAPAAPIERGRPSPARPQARAAWLARAGEASSTVRDVESLRGLVLEAALGELRDATVGQVAELSDRLAYVCAALLAAALERPEPHGAVDPPSVAVPAGGERVLYSSPPTATGARHAVLIDERDEPAGSPARVRDVPAAAGTPMPSRQGAAPRARGVPESGREGRPRGAVPRPRPWDTPLDAASSSSRRLADPPSRAAVPDARGAEMQVTRGPGAPVDERA